MRRYSSLILLLIVAITTLAACEDYGNPLDPASMRAKPFQKQQPTQKAAPAGEPADQKSAQLEDYQRPTYPNGVRRNPFQPDPAFLIQQAQFENENTRVKEPLESFGLGQLRLGAIISGITIPKAMFIDPDGLGHFAKVGDRIGDGGYVISAIRENSVTLTNDNSDDDGNGSNVAHQTQVIRLSDQLDNEEQQLSDEDRAALARILNSSAGQKAVRQSIETNNAGSNSYDSNSNSNAPGSEGGQ